MTSHTGMVVDSVGQTGGRIAFTNLDTNDTAAFATSAIEGWIEKPERSTVVLLLASGRTFTLAVRTDQHADPEMYVEVVDELIRASNNLATSSGRLTDGRP